MKAPSGSRLFAATLLLAAAGSLAEYGEYDLLAASNSADTPSGNTPRALGIGDYAWDQFTPSLPALDGAQYSLDHWRGKVILLNFWASWCSPCQYEIPKLVRLQDHYGADGFQVIGIGVDKTRPLRNVSRSLGVNYPVLVAKDATGTNLLKRWGNSQQVVPYNVVVGADGRIVHVQQGQFDTEMFDEYVAPLLVQP